MNLRPPSPVRKRPSGRPPSKVEGLIVAEADITMEMKVVLGVVSRALHLLTSEWHDGCVFLVLAPAAAAP